MENPILFGCSSLSSEREYSDDLTQVFDRSKVSFTLHNEVSKELPNDELPRPNFSLQLPFTKPQSHLHELTVSSDSFKDWSSTPRQGRQANLSGKDLPRLRTAWNSPLKNSDSNHQEQPRATITQAPSSSRLEALPSDILGQVIDLLEIRLARQALMAHSTDLMSLLLASRSIHAATLDTLYRRIAIPHSRLFRKLLNTIVAYPSLASIVRRLDFSHFNPSIICATAAERASTGNLTSKTLSECLDLTHFLQDFLAQEYIEDDLNADILRKLFLDMPRIQALDFCGCSSARFRNGFKEILVEPWPKTLNITRLSFHKCINLPPAVFETIIPCLHRLTHLDVAGTRITDEALASIPTTARITHLNLAKCRELSFEATVKLLINSSAVNKSIVYLSVSNNTTGHLLLGKVGVGQLLRSLPPTIRSLSLKDSHMDAFHVPLLAKLSQNLEELAIGRGLAHSDICQMLTHQGKRQRHSLRYLDISDTGMVIDSVSSLLAPDTAPLSTIELEERMYQRVVKNKKSLERFGWRCKEFGSRSWLVRLHRDGERDGDSGERWWKMGAEDWGMRKIPVADAEPSGMYGSFMFGRQ